MARTGYAGCTASSTITIPNPNCILYAVTMSFSGCVSGPYEHGDTVTGLLTIDSTAAPAVLEGGAIWKDDDDEGGAGSGNTDFYFIPQQFPQLSLAPAAAQSGAIIAPETKAKATDPVEFPFRLLSFGAQYEVEDLSA